MADGNGETETRDLLIHPVRWEGSIPYGAWICTPVSGCDIATPGAYGSERFEDLANGTLAGGNLTLKWTPGGPLTEEMSVGAYLLMPGCDSCNETNLGPDITGPSPLTLAIEGGPIVEAGMQLHIWVYGGPYESVGPVDVGSSGSQMFLLEGALTILAEPGTTA